MDCLFETARALAHGDELAQRQALALFEALGARPMVERVRHRLRTAGARHFPRGAQRSTREHRCGLTSKEVAVLELLAAGLRNKEIALRLHRSARTVEHHLAAIFAKLGVATRAEAVSAAYRLGSSQRVRRALKTPVEFCLSFTRADPSAQGDDHMPSRVETHRPVVARAKLVYATPEAR